MIKNLLFYINKEGYIFIFIAFIFALVMARFNVHLGWIGFIVSAGCIYFFRDPVRYVCQEEDIIISPADGTIVKISEEYLPEEFNNQTDLYTKISIFLSVFDVHVNRIPISGTIEKLHYHPGKFVSANLDKASKENERQSILVNTKENIKIVFVQIAGLIAKRIICNLQEGQEVFAGERFGIIRFGSRVDLYLPTDTQIFVTPGQKVVGGESIIAHLKPENKRNIHFEPI